MKKIILALGVLVSITTSAWADNQISKGDFEIISNGGYVHPIRLNNKTGEAWVFYANEGGWVKIQETDKVTINT